MNTQKKRHVTYAFIDASNLFYGGEKSLGWNIDYKRLFDYLVQKYGVERCFYFGGIETHNFDFHYLERDTVPLNELEEYFAGLLKEPENSELDEAELALIGQYLSRLKFYQKLESFGYQLVMRPVKSYIQEDGTTKRKANVDVDMTFYLMREAKNYDRAIVLSGDGDFLPVLKYLKEQGKHITVFARGPRTAKEIKQFAGSDFRDFVKLENRISRHWHDSKYDSKNK